MSKERLEKIKKEFYIHDMLTFADGETIAFNRDDIEWLIQQAERVSKQETRINNLTFDLAASRAQNKRHREALKFYADERSYEDIGIPTGNNPSALPILEDRGQVARKELEGEEC